MTAATPEAELHRIIESRHTAHDDTHRQLARELLTAREKFEAVQTRRFSAERRVAELEAQLERADDPCPHDPVGYVHAGTVSVHSCAACRVRVEGWVQWRTGERATFTEFGKEAGR